VSRWRNGELGLCTRAKYIRNKFIYYDIYEKNIAERRENILVGLRYGNGWEIHVLPFQECTQNRNEFGGDQAEARRGNGSVSRRKIKRRWTNILIQSIGHADKRCWKTLMADTVHTFEKAISIKMQLKLICELQAILIFQISIKEETQIARSALTLYSVTSPSRPLLTFPPSQQISMNKISFQ
jgi:hypothetical protein